MPAADTRQLRRRQDDLAVQIDRQSAPVAPGNTTVLGITTAIVSYPTTSQVYVAFTPVTPGGTEAEGTAPTLTTGTGTPLGACLLATIPAVGTYALFTLIDGRWILA